MSTPVDREGTFRANITGFGVKQMDSGTVGIALRALLTEAWDGEQWDANWKQYDMEADGDLWIIKKDGSPNDNAIRSLVEFAGWDGNIESIANETWQPSPCQVVVKRDEYKGTVRFKIAFLNDYHRTPGGMSNIDATKARELQARFGPQFRAIAGNVKRNGPPPAASAPSRPTPAAPPPPPPSKVAEGEQIPW